MTGAIVYDTPVSITEAPCDMPVSIAEAPSNVPSAVMKPVDLSAPVSEYGIDTRIESALFNYGIQTKGELIQHTEAEVERIPRMGKKSWKELRERVIAEGLSFRTPEPSDPNSIEALCSRRLFLFLKKKGIVKIEELATYSEIELSKTPGIGKGYMMEIKNIFDTLGLVFNESK